MKNSDSFHISAHNIDCGYSLEPPRRGGSNEYPQSMFLSRNKKINVYPCKPHFYWIKVRFKGVLLYKRVFVMNNDKTNATYETTGAKTKKNCNRGTHCFYIKYIPNAYFLKKKIKML